MKKNTSKTLITVIVVSLALALGITACQPAGAPTPSAEEIAQQVAYTQQAKATQNSIETLVAIVTELSKPTNTPEPTNTPMPTPTVAAPTASLGTATPTTAPANVSKCYQMEFLGDVNYAPGSVLKPGVSFTKTWRVKNTGTCKWTTDFDLAFVGGDAMGTNKRGDITKVVNPGDIVELSINMKAPSTNGTYWSYWMIMDPQGARFGYGPNNEWSLGIQIEVKG